MSNKFIILFLTAIIILSGCSMSYRKINYRGSFQTDTISNKKPEISILCSDIEVVSGKNRWLARKLERDGLVLVPVEVQNSSKEPFAISSNTIDFINDFTQVEMVESSKYLKKVRQKVWPNLLLLPIAFATSIKHEEVDLPGGGKGFAEVYRINLISGAIAAWGIINTSRTLFANIKARKDFLQNDLYYKNIPPNSVKYGFICIKAKEINQPMIRIKKFANQINP